MRLSGRRVSERARLANSASDERELTITIDETTGTTSTEVGAVVKNLLQLALG